MYVAKGWFDLAVKENREMDSRKWPLYIDHNRALPYRGM